MQKIRVFVISNFTPVMFMTAYFQQENLKNSDFRNICIVLVKDGLTADDPFIDALKKIAKLISPEIFICPEPKTGYLRMSLRTIFSDRKRKMDYLATVKNFFSENNLDYFQIKEIYHGPRVFHQYIKYLNPKVNLISFEHGLGDIRCHLEAPLRWERMKNLLKVIVGRLFFVFYLYDDNDNLRVSLMASRIRKIHRRLPIKQLDPAYIKKVTKIIVGEDLNRSFSIEQCGSVAIVLLSPINRLTDKKDDHKKVYRDFFKYILGTFEKNLSGIDTLIFKAKYFDFYSSDVKAEAREIIRNYRVVFFDEISKTNYSVEYYLDFIQPKMIIGESSTGLFYAKELMPEVKTYTYHNSMMVYLAKTIGIVNTEFLWIPKIFYEKYRSIFEDILPIEIP